MNCFYCKGNTVPSFTSHFAEVHEKYIIIENVPCDECAQCGEKFYNGDVALKIDLILKDYEKVNNKVTVISYTDKIVA